MRSYLEIMGQNLGRFGKSSAFSYLVFGNPQANPQPCTECGKPPDGLAGDWPCVPPTGLSKFRGEKPLYRKNFLRSEKAAIGVSEKRHVLRWSSVADTNGEVPYGHPNHIPQWKERGEESWAPNVAKCGRPTRQDSSNGPKGSPCQRPRGWGTDHPGYGPCKFHGGAFPNATVAAAREEAEEMALKAMGPAVEVDPMDALLWCVRIAAGEVAYATYRIEQDVDEDSVIARPETDIQRSGHEGFTEHKEDPFDMNVWIKVRHSALDRLAKYSKMALDAGIAQQQINLAEQAGDKLAIAIRVMLEGLNLTPEQEKNAPALVRSALETLEGTPVDRPAIAA